MRTTRRICARTWSSGWRWRGRRARGGGRAARGWSGGRERRLARATPADTVRGSFFLGALEAVRALEGEEGVRHCVEAGGEPRFVEFFNYPVGAWLQGGGGGGGGRGCAPAGRREASRASWSSSTTRWGPG